LIFFVYNFWRGKGGEKEGLNMLGAKI